MFFHWQPHADGQDMLSSLTIRQGDEPNHLWVGKRKLACLDLGKDPKKRLLAGDWINVNAIASQPREKLWFGTQMYREGKGWIAGWGGEANTFSSWEQERRVDLR